MPSFFLSGFARAAMMAKYLCNVAGERVAVSN